MFNERLLRALILLVIGVASNIISGTSLGNIKNELDYKKFKTGLDKGISLILVILLISLGASIDKEIMINGKPIVEYLINGITVTYGYYFAQSGVKVLNIIGYKVEMEENKNGN